MNLACMLSTQPGVCYLLPVLVEICSIFGEAVLVTYYDHFPTPHQERKMTIHCYKAGLKIRNKVHVCVTSSSSASCRQFTGIVYQQPVHEAINSSC